MILISKEVVYEILSFSLTIFDIESRLHSERLPTVILKFICGGDKKLTVIEIVSANATFSEVSLGCCRTSKMALFAKIVTGFRPLNVFPKKTNLEV